MTREADQSATFKCAAADKWEADAQNAGQMGALLVVAAKLVRGASERAGADLSTLPNIQEAMLSHEGLVAEARRWVRSARHSPHREDREGVAELTSALAALEDQ